MCITIGLSSPFRDPLAAAPGFTSREWKEYAAGVSVTSTKTFPDAAELGQAQPDNTSTSALYLRHRAELVTFIRRRFGSGPPDPEDIAQQAFANYAALGAGDAVTNPRAFLFRTAHNIVLNDRKHTRIGGRFLDSNPDPKEICEAREDFNPEVVLANRQRYWLVEQAIRAMPLKRRQCLLLHRIEGLSYAEIARRLGYSETNVRKQVMLGIRDCGAVLDEADSPLSKSRSGP